MAVQTIRIRNRAENPSVAKVAVQPAMRDLVEFSFGEGLSQQFAHILKTDREASEIAMADLTELARSYLTWKETPISSREIVRGELHQIAHLETVDQLQVVLPKSDKDTETFLWAYLKTAPDWPDGQNAFHWLRAEPDLAIIRTAAAAAARGLKAGDYANHDLHAAVGALIEIFEAYSSERATVGRLRSDAPLPSIARLFFEQVDPELPWKTIWNALDQEVRARKRRAAS
jgi:hypothetical protein